MWVQIMASERISVKVENNGGDKMSVKSKVKISVIVKIRYK